MSTHNLPKITAGAVALTLSATMLSSPAQASESSSSPTIEREVPVSSDAESANLKYSDIDVVALLVFGRGKIAQDQPRLGKQFDSGLDDDQIPNGAIEGLTDELKKIDPEFHQKVTTGVQKNDPEAAESAVKRLKADLDKLAKKYEKANGGKTSANKIEPTGKGKFKTNYVVTTDIVAATEAVVADWVALAVAVAGVAVVAYKFDGDESTSIERENIYKQLSSL